MVGTPRSVQAALKEIGACLDEGIQNEEDREHHAYRRRVSVYQSPKMSPKEDFPQMSTKKTGFASLTTLNGQTIQEFEQVNILAREEADRKDQTKLSRSVSNLQQADEDCKARMKEAVDDFAKRNEKYPGNFEKIDPKGERQDQVWGGNMGRMKTKRSKTDKRLQRSMVTPDIRSDLPIQCGVDVVQLKQHNRDVSKIERAAWEGRKEAQEEQKERGSKRKKNTQDESESASTELVTKRTISRTTAKNAKRKQKRAEKVRAEDAKPDHTTIDITSTSESPEPVSRAGYRMSAEDREYLETNMPRFYAECVGAFSANGKHQGVTEMNPIDESNIDSFLSNLPSGWGVAA